MKKRDEGYALPFVLVVMVVLCLVAVSVMSFALRNLKSQQVSVQRMQDQYAAQGEIEKILAGLDTFSENESFEFDGEGLTVCYDNSDSELLILTARNGTVLITCELNITENAPSLTVAGKQKFTLTGTGPVTYEFISYEISTADPAEEGGAGNEA